MLRRAATSLGRQRACEIGQCVLARDGVAIGEGSVVTIR